MKDSTEQAREAYARGDAFYEQENYEKALECYLEANRLSPQNILYLHDAGLMYYYLSASEKALNCYEKAFAIATERNSNKDRALLWKRFAEVWIDLGDIPKAIEYYEKRLTYHLERYGEGHEELAGDYHDLGLV